MKLAQLEPLETLNRASNILLRIEVRLIAQAFNSPLGSAEEKDYFDAFDLVRARFRHIDADWFISL